MEVKAKCCNRCNESKEIDSFGVDRRSRDGHNLYCRKCNAEMSVNRSIKNPERKRATTQKYRNKNREKEKQYSITYRKRDPRPHMVAAARKRADYYQLPFSITVDDIVIPEYCPILGIMLINNAGNGQKSSGSSPSIDRLIPELGYIPSNIAVISKRANVIKNNGTIEDHLRIANWMKEHGCK